MKLNFAKLNPTQNMTIIVTDPAPREQYAPIAAQLMAYGSVGAEQVGFLEEPLLPGSHARLCMAGGEFCGNATMSLGALLAHREALEDGGVRDYRLEISGAEGQLSCRIERRGSAFLGTVNMPLPRKIGTVGGYPAVFFDGIVHAIVPRDAMADSGAEVFARARCAELGADAFGVMLVDSRMHSMRPFVYVREGGSGIWERGCGSGTAAVGAFAAAQRGGRIALELAQPGGTMCAEAEYANGGLRALSISGEVRLSAVGQAWVEL